MGDPLTYLILVSHLLNLICVNDLQHSSVTYISASIEIWVVIVCILEHQWSGSPSYIINPERNIDWNKANRTSGLSGFGIKVSCGPQFVSVKEIFFCWIDKKT